MIICTNAEENCRRKVHAEATSQLSGEREIWRRDCDGWERETEVSVASPSSTGTAMSTKIRVVVSSFGRPVVESFPTYTRKVALPESRALYTVLRSPHIDKKSREQFEMRIQKHVLDIKAERHELHHKLFWLKRHRMLGAQFEVQVSCKTRLDPKLLPLPQNRLHTRNLEQSVNKQSQDQSS